ncbi:MAG: putative cytosolic protein [Deltaproteobacteria bacterium]|nr:putative cytosolic protein [Deltaproteobacteria bacterium]
MAKHSHTFVETYDGFLGYGMDRQTDENTVEVYLQKFSDDELMKVILKRMSDTELAEMFEMVSKMLKIYFTEPEYHRYFLKDEDQ